MVPTAVDTMSNRCLVSFIYVGPEPVSHATTIRLPLRAKCRPDTMEASSFGPKPRFNLESKHSLKEKRRLFAQKLAQKTD